MASFWIQQQDRTTKKDYIMSVIKASRFVVRNEPDSSKPFDFDEKTGSFKLESFDVDPSTLKSGEIIIEVVYLSNDPAQKFWISSVDKAYSAGTPVGQVVPARGIGKVIYSKSKKFVQGDYVSGLLGWATHALKNDSVSLDPKLNIIKLDPTVRPLWLYLSLLGSTGLTAYFIFFHYAHLQERPEDYGKTFLITGAAGAVGTVSIQLALNVFKAAKVIAVVGGADKIKFVESFGDAVVGVDYKSPEFKEKLIEAAGGTDTVDYFVDNVGGEILDFAMAKLMKPLSTILACGSISAYNDASKAALNNYLFVITKRLNIKGLLVTDQREHWEEAINRLRQLINQGKLDTKHAATIVNASSSEFHTIPKIWSGLFSGTNKAKLITQLSNE